MGSNLCSLRSSPEPFLELDESVEPEPPKDPKTSILELIKPGCLKTDEMKNKRQFQFHPQEKKISKVRKLTLEECLLASPGFNQEFINGGELHMFRQSSRVYPSTSRFHTTHYSPKPREIFSVVGLVKVDDNDDKRNSVSSSLCSSPRRSQSEKVKKNVSFKLPEEADIIIFYSPKQEFYSPKEEMVE
ncbi:Phospholipase C [Macleaya cordata]|uniref:Phospholipase C n=1 Tax=Macleaya cordata TaxID=56857 RepID=A0A200QHZ9_MACCD|nr:Phospholipase C [Macleaya cordata]